MKPFHSSNPCPKCGSKMSFAEYKHTREGEHIERTCGRCGYKWKEATLDSQEQQEK